MAARRETPTEAETRYLLVNEELRVKRIARTHPEMQRRLGYKSIASVWQLYEQLVSKGWLDPEGESLVIVKGPTTTAKARRFLRSINRKAA